MDLSEVRDPQALNGREFTVTGNVGHLDIRVPADVTVVANTHVDQGRAASTPSTATVAASTPT